MAQAGGRSAEQVARIQQAIGQLEAATEELARQRAAAEAQLGQREIADEAEARHPPGRPFPELLKRGCMVRLWPRSVGVVLIEIVPDCHVGF